jgi:molybdenum cofactor cytidylyltransferase
LITAVILAAGQSRRMGKPKINLPWKNTTVLGAIVEILFESGIVDIVIVTGEAPVHGLVEQEGLRLYFIKNPRAAESGMLVSLQIGLRQVKSHMDAVMVVLGDQPQIESKVVQALVREFSNKKGSIIVPSFRMRRGHPLIIGKPFWENLLSLPSEKSLRDFLDSQIQKTIYVNVDSESILQDLDTPDDYAQYLPKP